MLRGLIEMGIQKLARRSNESQNLIHIPLKCVVTGDPIKINETTINSAHLLTFYIQPSDVNLEYLPTVFENSTITYKLRGRNYQLSLWSTEGQADYSRLRTLSYPGTDFVILYFSYANRDSFLNVENKWYPEIKHNIRTAKIILLGLHSTPENEIITEKEIEALAKKLKISYFSCASLSSQNIKEAFNAIFDDYLMQHFKLSSPTFFNTHFSCPIEAKKYAIQVAHLTRGHKQDDDETRCILATIPTEVFFLILEKLGESLLIPDTNNQYIKSLDALRMLYELVFNNAMNAKASREKESISDTIFWKRTYTQGNGTEVVIYPEKKNESEDHKPKKRFIF